ncbi:unnamed protein product [Heterobilharzia americana]|nr:unnamed protein product [Heterobilharzia americana]
MQCMSSCLTDLIRQAYDLILPGSPHYSVILMKTPLSPAVTAQILESLKLPEHPLARVTDDRCASCATRFIQLKIDALSYVRRSVLSATTGKLTKVSPKLMRLNQDRMNPLPVDTAPCQSTEQDPHKSKWIRSSGSDDQFSQSSQLYNSPVNDKPRHQNSRQHIFRLEGSLQNSPQNYTTLGFKLLNDQLRADCHTVQHSQISNTEVNRFDESLCRNSLSKKTSARNTPLIPRVQADYKPLRTLNPTSPGQHILQRPYYPAVYNSPNTEIYHHIGTQRNLQTNSNLICDSYTNNKVNNGVLYTGLDNCKGSFQPLYLIGGINNNNSQLSYPDYSRPIRWAAEQGLISAAKQRQILWESSREKNSSHQLMQSRSEDQSINQGGDIHPSIVNTRQRLETSVSLKNESDKNQTDEQGKNVNLSSEDNNGIRQASVTQISAAASFFTRAGQKLAITNSSKRKRKSPHNDISDVSHLTGHPTSPSYRHSQHSKCITGFSEAMHHYPPPMPPTLLKWGRNGSNNAALNNRVGKLK